jgi:nucleotide-binding universal stress UspA family protein
MASGFKDLLVVVDGGQAGEGRMDLAAWLAARLGAHLVGLYPLPHGDGPAYAFAVNPSLLLGMRAAAMAGAQEQAAQLRQGFDAATARHGLAAEWRASEGFAGDLAALNARYADLAIVGQRASGVSDFAHPRPEDVTLASGCPVLVVPQLGRFERIERHALVAWNASREARRAVNDAIPLLRLVERVTVLAINPRHGITGHGDHPGADIAVHLARHGIAAETEETVTAELEPADTLLARAADLGSDLIVMGASGHSRMRALTFGDTTRAILRHMTVPVLMSH